MYAVETEQGRYDPAVTRGRRGRRWTGCWASRSLRASNASGMTLQQPGGWLRHPNTVDLRRLIAVSPESVRRPRRSNPDDCQSSRGCPLSGIRSLRLMQNPAVADVAAGQEREVEAFHITLLVVGYGGGGA